MKITKRPVDIFTYILELNEGEAKDILTFLSACDGSSNSPESDAWDATVDLKGGLIKQGVTTHWSR